MRVQIDDKSPAPTTTMPSTTFYSCDGSPFAAELSAIGPDLKWYTSDSPTFVKKRGENYNAIISIEKSAFVTQVVNGCESEPLIFDVQYLIDNNYTIANNTLYLAEDKAQRIRVLIDDVLVKDGPENFVELSKDDRYQIEIYKDNCIFRGILLIAGYEDDTLQKNIYPNPASESFNISLTTQAPAIISISNVSGSEVANYKLDKGEHNFEVDVRNWSKGLHYIKVTEGTSIKVTKIVIN